MDSLSVCSLTGPELKARRRAHGINQTQMGQLIECSRHAVSYWETQAGPMTRKRLRWGVPARMCEVLGIEVLPNYSPLCAPAPARHGVLLPIKGTTTHPRGDGVLDDTLQAALDRESARQLDRIEAQAARYRQPCQAMTRKGQPCRMKSEAGRRRCKFHGGLSTGPKTAEGRARIAEAQRRRWARHRAGVVKSSGDAITGPDWQAPCNR
jgi:DNA-binding XRE family transcriptional regulator